MGHFKLEETSLGNGAEIDDASSNDADLQVVTGATSATGKINNSLTFNGSTQYLKQQVHLSAAQITRVDTAGSAAVEITGLSTYATTSQPYNYMVVSTNCTTTGWGYLGAVIAGDNLKVFSTKTGTTQNWATVPSGGTCDTFEVRETEFQITGNFSLGAWIKGTDQSGGIIGKWSAAGYLLHVDISTARVYVNNSSRTSSIATLNDNLWHHIVGTWDGTNLNMYVDGTLSNGTLIGSPTNPTDASHRFAVSGYEPFIYDLLSDIIDEPFVISSALTADQVKALYEYYTLSTSHTATKTTPANSADGTNDTSYHVYTLSSLSASSNLVQDSTTLATSTTNLPAVAQYARLQNTDASNALSVDWIAVIKPATASPTTALASEEQSQGPVAYWSFDDGQGSVAQDKTSNNNDGTLGTGSSAPSWATSDLCVTGACLKFDNIDDTVSVANSISGIKTVSFWVKPNTTTEYFVDLNGSAYISSTSGAISATGFTTPVYYVNGRAMTSPTLTANQWNYITVTTTSGLTGSAIRLGKIGTNHLQGFLDDVKIYPYARSAAQIKLDYNGRGVAKGASVKISSSSAGISNGLVGYWNMDTGSGTTAPDLSGNSNTATLGSGDSAPSWASAKYGSGLSFDGNDYVNIGTSFSQSLTSFSISTWINTTQTTAYSFYNVVERGAWNSGEIGLFMCGSDGTCPANGRIRFQAQELTTNVKVDSSTSVNDGNWHHAVSSYDGLSLKIYIDGKLSNTAVATGSISSDTEATYIGARTGSTLFWNGKLDEVRIYNRALSPLEVRQLYEWAPGPVAHFKLDDGSGTSPVDSSGFSRTGTVVNGTWTTGKVGKGLKLDGSGDYLQITDF